MTGSFLNILAFERKLLTAHNETNPIAPFLNPPKSIN